MFIPIAVFVVLGVGTIAYKNRRKSFSVSPSVSSGLVPAKSTRPFLSKAVSVKQPPGVYANPQQLEKLIDTTRWAVYGDKTAPRFEMDLRNMNTPYEKYFLARQTLLSQARRGINRGSLWNDKGDISEKRRAETIRTAAALLTDLSLNPGMTAQGVAAQADQFALTLEGTELCGTNYDPMWNVLWFHLIGAAYRPLPNNKDIRALSIARKGICVHRMNLSKESATRVRASSSLLDKRLWLENAIGYRVILWPNHPDADYYMPRS